MSEFDIEYNKMVRDLAKSGESILRTLTPARCHVWHMVSALMGETIELLEFTDLDNLVEEVGDCCFHLEGIADLFSDNFYTVYVNEYSEDSGELDPLYKDMVFMIDPVKQEYNLKAVICDAGLLFDSCKKSLIYGKSDLTLDLIKMPCIRIYQKLDRICKLNKITLDYARKKNMDKLLKGKNARYKSGVYSDEQATQRSDKTS